MKLKYLKEATKIVFYKNFTDARVWQAILEGLRVAGIFVVRLLMLVIFPISIPLVMLLAEYQDKKDAESFEKANKDFFKELNKERVSK